MSNVEKENHEPLREGTVKMEVMEIIKAGFEEIKTDLDRYFIRRNSETTGHYYSTLSQIHKASIELIDRMLKIKF